jgi:hypothetical protein
MHETEDLIIDRPVMAPPYRRHEPLDSALREPSAVDPAEHVNVPPDSVETMESA